MTPVTSNPLTTGFNTLYSDIVDGEKYNAKSVMSLLQAGGAIADKGHTTVEFQGSKQAIDDVKILANYNYCDEGEFPNKLSYLRAD